MNTRSAIRTVLAATLIGRRPVLSGVVYGICIWLGMNFVVVPPSNTGASAPQVALGVIMNLGFAML